MTGGRGCGDGYPVKKTAGGLQWFVSPKNEQLEVGPGLTWGTEVIWGDWSIYRPQPRLTKGSTGFTGQENSGVHHRY